MHQLEEIGVALFVIFMMVSVGLDVTVDRVVEVFRHPRRLLAGVAVNYVGVPAVAWVVTRWLALPYAVTAGILLISVAPGGPVGAVFARSAGGNLALATSLVVVMNVANTVLTPALAGVLSIAPEGAADVPVGPMIRTIVLYQLIPLVLSMTLRRYREETAKRWSKKANTLANVVLVLVGVVFVFTSGPKAIEVPPLTFLAIAICVLASLAMGYLLTPGDRVDRVGVSMTSGVRSMSVVLLIIAAWFPQPLTLLGALSYSVTMFVITVSASWIIRRTLTA